MSTYYEKNKERLFKKAKQYYEHDKEILKEQAKLDIENYLMNKKT